MTSEATIMNDKEKIIELLKIEKNVILSGAPGTGKTFIAPEIAVGLCSPNSFNDRGGIIAKYKKLVEEGRVVFCTFHPSFDYEDFVEGFKPQSIGSGEKVEVRLQSGVLKKIVQKIHDSTNTNLRIFEEVKEGATLWKVTPGGTINKPEEDFREDTFKNNRIRIGWEKLGQDSKQESVDSFCNKMKVGDVVLSEYDRSHFDGIGIIEGDANFDPSLGAHTRTRSVKWVYVGEPISILPLNAETAFDRDTVQKLKRINLKSFKTYVLDAISKTPYLLIIDEINRGNSAKIFGELITLLEKDKREGEVTEIEVNLPYSQEKFSLPDNLYILATMNSADKTVGSLDYALRRRFAFYKMIPRKIERNDFDFESFEKVSRLFVEDPSSEILRPSKYLSSDYDPEDVWLGSSYFLGNTKLKFEFQIYPLLKEYLADGIFDGARKEAQEKIEDIRKEVMQKS